MNNNKETLQQLTFEQMLLFHTIVNIEIDSLTLFCKEFKEGVLNPKNKKWQKHMMFCELKDGIERIKWTKKYVELMFGKGNTIKLFNSFHNKEKPTSYSLSTMTPSEHREHILTQVTCFINYLKLVN